MTKEELKVRLSKQWGDTGNSDFTRFLWEFVKVQYTQYIEGKYAIRYSPIFIPSRALGVLITDYCNSQDSEDCLYRDMVFVEYYKPGVNSFRYEFKEIKGASSYRDVVIKDGRIGLVDSVQSLELSSDFVVSYNFERLAEGVYLDVVNRKIDLTGDISSPLDYICMLMPQTNGAKITPKRWVELIDKESSLNHDFKSACEALKARELITSDVPHIGRRQLVEAFSMLFAYVDNEDVKHVIAHPWARKEMGAKMFYYHLYEESAQKYYNDYVSSSLVGANSALQVLGINPLFEEFFERNLSCFNLKSMLKAQYVIATMGRFVKLETTESLNKLVELLGSSSRLHPFKLTGELLYLFKMGYDLDGIHKYLTKVNKYQGIPVSEGFEMLYQTSWYREFLTGEKKKFYPKHLEVTFSVLQRDFFEEKGKDSGRTVRNIYHQTVVIGDEVADKLIKRRIDLIESNDDFETVLENKDNLNYDSYSSLLSGVDFIYYKKKKGSKQFPITLLGDAVVNFDHKGLGPAHVKRLREWAHQKGLLMDFSLDD